MKSPDPAATISELLQDHGSSSPVSIGGSTASTSPTSQSQVRGGSQGSDVAGSTKLIKICGFTRVSDVLHALQQRVR